MGALAHLPVLLHPEPENAVVICIGTGTTVGALTTYESLSDIHAVDRSFELRALQPDDLLGIWEDVSKYLTAPPSNPAALEAARQAVMLSHHVFVEKDVVKKGALANEALELRPDNAFLQWQAEKSQP